MHVWNPRAIVKMAKLDLPVRKVYKMVEVEKDEEADIIMGDKRYKWIEIKEEEKEK